MRLNLREELVGASTHRCRPDGPPFAHALHARKANHRLTGSGVFKPYVHAVERGGAGGWCPQDGGPTVDRAARRSPAKLRGMYRGATSRKLNLVQAYLAKPLT